MCAEALEANQRARARVFLVAEPVSAPKNTLAQSAFYAMHSCQEFKRHQHNQAALLINRTNINALDRAIARYSSFSLSTPSNLFRPSDTPPHNVHTTMYATHSQPVNQSQNAASMLPVDAKIHENSHILHTHHNRNRSAFGSPVRRLTCRKTSMKPSIAPTKEWRDARTSNSANRSID